MRRAILTYSSQKQVRFDLPVVSIGNISHGGTGKTPMTLWLAHFFEKNNTPVIATRGYKSQIEKTGALLLAKTSEHSETDALKYGDEPILLHQNLEKTDIVIGAKRSKLLKNYFEKKEANILLLEDGFQHLKIHRDLDIVLVDAAYDIRSTLFYPLHFREPLHALGDAHIVILTNSHLCSERVIAKTKDRIRPYIDKNCEVFQAGYKLGEPKQAHTGEALPFSQINSESEKKVLGFCGLAKSQNFWSSLSKAGVSLSYKISFPDHHVYTRKDIDHVLQKTEESQCQYILTTEKDIVKIRKLLKPDELIHFTKASLTFYDEQTKLEQCLTKVIKQRGIEL